MPKSKSNNPNDNESKIDMVAQASMQQLIASVYSLSRYGLDSKRPFSADAEKWLDSEVKKHKVNIAELSVPTKLVDIVEQICSCIDNLKIDNSISERIKKGAQDPNGLGSLDSNGLMDLLQAWIQQNKNSIKGSDEITQLKLLANKVSYMVAADPDADDFASRIKLMAKYEGLVRMVSDVSTATVLSSFAELKRTADKQAGDIMRLKQEIQKRLAEQNKQDVTLKELTNRQDKLSARQDNIHKSLR